MAKTITIIGNTSEKNGIEVLCSKLQVIGIESQVLYPALDYASKGLAVSAPVAILWISSKSDDESFVIAKERNAKGLSTINYFADALDLSELRRKTIGRNKSVFADLNPDESVKDLVACADLKTIDTGHRNVSADSEISNTSNKLQSASASTSISTSATTSTYTSTSTSASATTSSSASVSPTPASPSPVASAVASVVSNACGVDLRAMVADNEEEANGQAISPWNAVLRMLGAIVGSVIIMKTISLSLGSIWGYFILGAPIVVVFKTWKKINQSRRLNGFDSKIFLAYVVAIISILISLCLMLGWLYSPYV